MDSTDAPRVKATSEAAGMVPPGSVAQVTAQVCGGSQPSSRPSAYHTGTQGRRNRLRSAVVSAYPGVRSARRICSGSCDYFTPVYQAGRKIAGVGTCENLHCGSPVQVGMMCLWAKESLTSEELLARMETRQERLVGA